GVVIQNIGLGLEHNAQRLFESLKIRNQDFHPASRSQQSNLANCFGKNLSSAHVVVIPIYAGDNRMFDPQGRHCFRHPRGFFVVNRLRLAFGHGAKSTAPRADISQQHESRRAVVPALANIGTLRRFADRVQPQATRQFLQLMEVLADRRFRLQPLGLRLPNWGAEFDLNQLRAASHSILDFTCWQADSRNDLNLRTRQSVASAYAASLSRVTVSPTRSSPAWATASAPLSSGQPLLSTYSSHAPAAWEVNTANSTSVVYPTELTMPLSKATLASTIPGPPRALVAMAR